MATRSRIGFETKQGTVKSIYCHFNGYPDGVGKTLQQHYTDPEKVEALVALGDISYLEPILEPTSPCIHHSFENPAPGVTVAYHRDRGDDFSPPRVDTSIETFSPSEFEDYGYVFTQQGEWKIFS